MKYLVLFSIKIRFGAAGLWLCLFLTFVSGLSAQVVPFNKEVFSSDISDGDEVKTHFLATANPFVCDTVYHDRVNQMGSGGSPHWTKKFKFKSVVDRIVIATNPFENRVMTSYAYRFSLRIIRWNTDLAVDSVTVTMVMEHNAAEFEKFNDQTTYEFYGYHKFLVKILDVEKLEPDSVTWSAVNWPLVQPNFQLTSFVDVQRYDLSDNGTFSINTSVGSPAISYNTTSGFIRFSWNDNPKFSPTAYELEWLHVDNYTYQSLTPLSSGSIYYDFRFNATRMLVNSDLCSIPNLYDRGYVVFRVRQVRPDTSTYSWPQYGNWTGAAESGTVSAAASYALSVADAHMDGKMNWLYQISFAEEGRLKAMSSYFDGSLRSRQHVTKLSTQPNYLLVTEQIYNYAGRPAIQILPAGVGIKPIQFVPDYAKPRDSAAFYAGIFDKLSCTPGLIQALDTTASYHSAGRYYSSLAPTGTPHADYVPNAGGYPFIHTEYMPDQTGRISRLGGAGAAFQLRQHDTRMAYSRPMQGQLNRLFGTESGENTFYRSVINIDPNGQTSINISDRSGKAVASMLAGKVPVGGSLAIDSLPQNTAAVSITEDLKDGQLLSPDGKGFVLSHPFYVENPASYSFSYGFDVPAFSLAAAGCNVCTGCAYDLKTYLLNDCKDTVFTRIYPAIGSDDGCGSYNFDLAYYGGSSTYTVSLETGQYFLYKSLTLSDSASSRKIDRIIAAMTDSGCILTENYYVKAAVDTVQYDQSCPGEEEVTDPCALIRRQMLDDVSPGGIYARYERNDQGVFVVTGPTNENVLSHYGDESCDGRVLFPTLTTYADGTTISGTAARALSVDSLIRQWHPSWAEALLVLHPDYCDLSNCETLQEDDILTFEEELDNITSYSKALSRGYLLLSDPVNHLIGLDPLMAQSLFTGYDEDDFRKTFGGTQTMGIDTLAALMAYGGSLSDDAYFYRADSASYVAGLTGLNETIAKEAFYDVNYRNSFWIAFKQLYLEKRNGFKKVYLTGIAPGCDPCFSIVRKGASLFSDIDDYIDSIPEDIAGYLANPTGSFNDASSQAAGALAAARIEQCELIIGQVLDTLANCSNFSSDSAAIRTALLSVCSAKGYIMAADLKTILDAELPGGYRNGLCNEYLIDFAQLFKEVRYTEHKYVSGSIYQINNYASEFGNVLDVMDQHDYAATNVKYPSAGANGFLDAVEVKLGGGAYCNDFSILYSKVDGTHIFDLGCTGSSQKVRIFLNDIDNSGFDFGDSTFTFQQLKADTAMMGQFNYNGNTPDSRYFFLVDAVVGSTHYTFRGWNSLIPLYDYPIELADKDPQQGINCLQCATLNDLLTAGDFSTTFSGIALDYSEPYTRHMIAAYLNKKLQYNLSESEYFDFITSCALNDVRLLPAAACDFSVEIADTDTSGYFAYMRAEFSDTLDILKWYAEYNTSTSRLTICFDLDAMPFDVRGYFKTYSTAYTDYFGSSMPLMKETLVMTVRFQGEEPGCELSDVTGFLSGVDGVSHQTVSQAFTSNYLTADQSGRLDIAIGDLTPDQVADLMRDLAAYFEECIRMGFMVVLPYQTYFDPESLFGSTAEICSTSCYGCDEIAEAVHSYRASLTGSRYEIAQDMREENISTYLSTVEGLPAGFTVHYGGSDCADCNNTLYVCSEPNENAAKIKNLFLKILETSNDEFLEDTASVAITVPQTLSAQLKFRQNSDSTLWLQFQTDVDYQIINLTIYYQPNSSYNYSQLWYTGADFQILPAAGGVNMILIPFFMSDGGLGSATIWLPAHVDVPVAACCATPYTVLCNRVDNNYATLDTLGCERMTYLEAAGYGKRRYLSYRDSIEAAVSLRYQQHCLNPDSLKEQLPFTYSDRQYQFTLYYYDLAGNLTRTVPPAWVSRLAVDSISAISAKRAAGDTTGTYRMSTLAFASTYKYTSFNQPYEQYTPDGKTTRFYYDALGRVVLSQNAKQAAQVPASYSYTLYDALGRIFETGETSGFSVDNEVQEELYLGDYTVEAYLLLYADPRVEVVRTYYDEELIDLSGTPVGTSQQNLRSRVAATAYYPVYIPGTTSNTSGYLYATHFSYDVGGNVKMMVQDYPELAPLEQQHKRIDYDFDLISGNVLLVSYQRGMPDQFYHRYQYDADNRITRTETSSDGVNWDNDAKYSYYLHGPLARTELGSHQVQGIDYAYTLQGWLKGMNGSGLTPTLDMGRDGSNATYAWAQDAAAFTLGYFAGDYKPARSTTAAVLHMEAGSAPAANLYNGNISNMVTGLKGMSTLGKSYRYDQLNRITSTDYYAVNFASSKFSWGSGTTAYTSDYGYDMNGNLQTLVRNEAGGADMDDFFYIYTAGTNRLERVEDYATSSGTLEDLKDGQSGTNYTYYQNGELATDVQGDLEITWTPYGKVKRVEKGSSTNFLEFGYNASGQRVKKYTQTSTSLNDRNFQIYVPDAQGNVLAVYEVNYEYPADEERFTYIIDYILETLDDPHMMEDILLLLADNPAFRTQLLKTVMPLGSFVNLMVTSQSPTFYMNEDINVLKPVILNSDDWVDNLHSANLSVYISALYQCDREWILSQIIAEDNAHLSAIISALCDGDQTFANQMYTYFTSNGMSDCYTDMAYLFDEGLSGVRKEDIIAYFLYHEDNMGPILEQFFTDVLSHWSVFDDIFQGANLERLQRLLVDCGDMGALKTFFISYFGGSLTSLRTHTGDHYLMYLLYMDDPESLISAFVTYQDKYIIDVLLGMEGFTLSDFLQLVLQVMGEGDTYNTLIEGLGEIYYDERISLAEHYIYGSKRLGVRRVDKGLYRNAVSYDGENITGYIGGDYLSDPRPGYLKEAAGIVDYVYLEAPLTSAGVVRYPTATAHYRNLGYKEYELTNHLGNVLATILDRRTGYKSSPSAYYYNYYTADVTNAQDYYPGGMLMPGRTYTASSAQNYRYGFNSQERDDEIYGAGNSYSAEFWQYDARIGRRWNLDPVIKSYQSGYSAFSNNPISRVDPNGADDYYNNKGVFIGTDGMNTNIRRVVDEEVFNSIQQNFSALPVTKTPSMSDYLSGAMQKAEALQSISRVIRVDESVNSVAQTVHENSYNEGKQGVEWTMNIVFDPENAVIFGELDVKGTGTATASFPPKKNGLGGYDNLNAPNVLLGTAHGHPKHPDIMMQNVSGVSIGIGLDTDKAKNNRYSVYAIDSYGGPTQGNISRANLNGTASNGIGNVNRLSIGNTGFNLGYDALENTGGKP